MFESFRALAGEAVRNVTEITHHQFQKQASADIQDSHLKDLNGLISESEQRLASIYPRIDTAIESLKGQPRYFDRLSVETFKNELAVIQAASKLMLSECRGLSDLRGCSKNAFPNTDIGDRVNTCEDEIALRLRKIYGCYREVSQRIQAQMSKINHPPMRGQSDGRVRECIKHLVHIKEFRELFPYNEILPHAFRSDAWISGRPELPDVLARADELTFNLPHHIHNGPFDSLPSTFHHFLQGSAIDKINQEHLGLFNDSLNRLSENLVSLEIRLTESNRSLEQMLGANDDSNLDHFGDLELKTFKNELNVMLSITEFLRTELGQLKALRSGLVDLTDKQSDEKNQLRIGLDQAERKLNQILNDVNASYRRCFDKIQSAFDTNTETDSNTFLLNGLESLRKNIKAYKGSLEAVSIGSEHPLLIVNLDSLVEDLDSITNPDE